MKRRALAMLLAVMMIISLIPVTASAEGCDHSDQTPYYVQDPDNSRYHFVYCGNCGHQYDYSSHHYHDGSCHCGAKDPNCQHTSTKQDKHNVLCADCGVLLNVTACNYVNGVCSICGATQAVVPSDPVPTPPACLHTSKRFYANDSQHWLVCADCGEMVGSKTNHAFNASGVCVCGAQAGDEIKPEVCGHERGRFVKGNDEVCNYVCTTCGLLLDTTEHVYGGVGEDLLNGYHAIECGQCGGAYSQEIHDFNEEGVCACGAEAEEGCRHDGEVKYFKDGGGHKRVCLKCGEETWLAHTPGKVGMWNGNKEKHNVYCADCGGAYTVQDHDFSSGECACGMPCPHLDVAYTQSEDGTQHQKYCTVCNAPLTEFVNHIFDTGVCECGMECPHAETVGIRLPNNLQEHKERCTICAAEFNVRHDEYAEESDTFAQYTTEQHGVSCAKCGDIYKMEDHTFEDGDCKFCEEPCTNCKEGATPTVAAKLGNEDDKCVERCGVCNKVLNIQEHVFRDNGKKVTCRNCGFVCMHTEQTATQYEEYADQECHKMICDLCGKTVNATAYHDFSGDGICDCGMQCGSEARPHDLPAACEVREDGTHYKVCQDCGAEVTSELGEAKPGAEGELCHNRWCSACNKNAKIPHTVIVNESVKPTGWRHPLICEVCGQDLGQELHTFNSECKCTVCGYECTHPENYRSTYTMDADGHTQSCRICKTVVVSEEHDWSGKNGVCAVCGYDCVHEDHEADCVEYNDYKHKVICSECDFRIGYVSHTYDENSKCTVCGHDCSHPEAKIQLEKDADGHAVKCGICGVEEEKQSHTWDSKTGKCTVCDYACAHPQADTEYEKDADGHIMKCGICGVVEEKQPHTWDSTTGKCTVCEYACAHPQAETEYEKDADGHAMKCGICGVEGEKQTHTWDSTTGKCTVCEYACAHPQAETEYEKDADGHTMKCKTCGVVEEKQPHTWDSETGKCTVCDYACAHPQAETEYEKDADGHTKKCGICGVEEEKQSHTWDSTTGKCTVCEYACAHPQAETEYEKDADGHTMKCKTCGVVEEKQAHTWDSETGKCTVCDYACAHPQAETEYEKDAAGHTKKCGICGVEEEKQSHTWDSTTGKCTVCEYACAHPQAETEYEKDADGHTMKCKTCGVVEEKQAHTWDRKTGKCTVCGMECPHTNKTYSNANSSKDGIWTCKACGATGVHEHTISYGSDKNRHWGNCTVCGYEGTHEKHEYPRYGSNKNICTVCGYKKS